MMRSPSSRLGRNPVDELINGKEDKVTHAGVLEFIAEEGKIYLPQWVRKNADIFDRHATDFFRVADEYPPPGAGRPPSDQIH